MQVKSSTNYGYSRVGFCEAKELNHKTNSLGPWEKY